MSVFGPEWLREPDPVDTSRDFQLVQSPLAIRQALTMEIAHLGRELCEDLDTVLTETADVGSAMIVTLPGGVQVRLAVVIELVQP